MKVDLHTHSTVSDGTDAPAEVVRRAHRLGVGVVALTDHDTFAGLPEAAAAAAEVGVVLVPGMEMSTHVRGRSVHLLAYGADPDDAALAAELDRVRDGREGRVPAVLAKLAALGVPITAEMVHRHAGGVSVGRPHIADALVEAGHVVNRDEAFRRFLHDGGPAHVDRYATPLPQALDLVHRAGGVTVLAHPWGRGSREVLSARAIGELVRDHQLDGLEVDHDDHGPAGSPQRAELRQLARTYDLLVTGSSDYHGTGKQGHEIGSNVTAAGMWDRLRRRLG